MSNQELLDKIETLPPNLQAEIVDFVEFVIHKHRLTASERIPGLAKGLIHVSGDFDEPLEDFKDYQ